MVDFPGVAKTIFAGAAKNGKISFHPLQNSESNLFLRKILWENV